MHTSVAILAQDVLVLAVVVVSSLLRAAQLTLHIGTVDHDLVSTGRVWTWNKFNYVGVYSYRPSGVTSKKS